MDRVITGRRVSFVLTRNSKIGVFTSKAGFSMGTQKISLAVHPPTGNFPTPTPEETEVSGSCLACWDLRLEVTGSLSHWLAAGIVSIHPHIVAIYPNRKKKRGKEK